MEAKELRIGNWVNESGDEVYVGKGTFRYWDELKLGDVLKPIPLTEEWLVKFGLEKTTDKMYWVQPTNFTYFELTNRGIIATDPDNCSDIGVRVKHVHQLQNLYFALTGEELTIKK